MSGDHHRKRRSLRRRDGAGCRWCGADDDETIDHVIPKSMGGSNKLENLVLSCLPCNQARGGVHGPGAHQSGLPAVPKGGNGHEKFIFGSVPPDRVRPYRPDELAAAIDAILSNFPARHRSPIDA